MVELLNSQFAPFAPIVPNAPPVFILSPKPLVVNKQKKDK